MKDDTSWSRGFIPVKQEWFKIQKSTTKSPHQIGGKKKTNIRLSSQQMQHKHLRIFATNSQ